MTGDSIIYKMTKKVNDKIDEFEALILGNCPTVDCPVTHKFAPGMYIRKIFMPAGKDGIWVTSLIHNTIHPFFVMKGKVTVYSENDGIQELETGYEGMTYPGTRRILHVKEDTVWITVHSTAVRPKNASDEAIQEAVDLIASEILEPHINHVLGAVVKNNVIKPMIEENNIVNIK